MDKSNNENHQQRKLSKIRRNKEYYKKNRTSICERMKTTYQSNQDAILSKKKHYYKINSKGTKRKNSNKSFSDSVHHHSKKHKSDGNQSFFDKENQNAD